MRYGMPRVAELTAEMPEDWIGGLISYLHFIAAQIRLAEAEAAPGATREQILRRAEDRVIGITEVPARIPNDSNLDSYGAAWCLYKYSREWDRMERRALFQDKWRYEIETAWYIQPRSGPFPNVVDWYAHGAQVD